MALNLIAIDSKKCVEMHSKTFGKLLHLARLQGWEPEKLPSNWPSTSWNTEVVLRDIEAYADGCVSKYDADGLRRALTRLMATEGLSFDKDLYMAASRFIEHLGNSAFLVKGEPGVETAFEQLAVAPASVG